MKFYFLKREFVVPEHWYVLFPEKFTFAIAQSGLPPKDAIIIINDGNLYYLTRIKNKGKFTTFEHRISCINTQNIECSIGDICELLRIKETKFIDSGKLLKITDDPKRSEKLKKYLLDKNPSLEGFFHEKQRYRNSKSKDVTLEAQDAFSTAFEIFKIPPNSYQNLTEQQILDWEINSMPEISKVTPDGKYFLEANGKRLFIQKVHNTPIEKCLGVDMIYNFYEEDRSIFIQYKCFNHKDKKFYKSQDKHLSVELKKMSSLVRNCVNNSVSDCTQIRICDCPFFIKLCSRNLPMHRDKAYGFYYTVCCWKKISSEKTPFISFDDEPKISNMLFNELMHSRLIGTRKDHIQEMQQKFSKNRLLLVFSEVKNPDLTYK